MIQIKWTHLAIGLALVIGLLVGSHFQMTPTLALAQSSTDSSTPVALTVYSNYIYIVRGNDLFMFKTVDNRFMKDRKDFIFVGKTQIDRGLSVETTNNSYNARPMLPLPGTSFPNRK